MTAAVTTRFIEDLTGIERLRAAVGNATISEAAAGFERNRTGHSATAKRQSQPLGFAGCRVRSIVGRLEPGFRLPVFDLRRQFQEIERDRTVSGLERSPAEPELPVHARCDPPGRCIRPTSTGTLRARLDALARANYSIRDKKLLEGLVGVEYNRGCWEFRLVAHRFTTAAQQYSNSVQFQLELKGLSKLGINPLETLRQNIVGYRRSDER